MWIHLIINDFTPLWSDNITSVTLFLLWKEFLQMAPFINWIVARLRNLGSQQWILCFVFYLSLPFLWKWCELISIILLFLSIQQSFSESQIPCWKIWTHGHSYFKNQYIWEKLIYITNTITNRAVMCFYPSINPSLSSHPIKN